MPTNTGSFEWATSQIQSQDTSYFQIVWQILFFNLYLHHIIPGSP